MVVNGIDCAANVIDQPERFHIIEGRACIADNEIVLFAFGPKATCDGRMRGWRYKNER